MESRKLVFGGLLAALAALGGIWFMVSGRGKEEPAKAEVAAAPHGGLSDEQFARLGVKTVTAALAENVPIGTVPATVTLPPESRVAVTASLPGAVRQVFVIEGQEVSRGQPLATIVSRDAMALGGNRSRAGARIDLARTNLARAEALYREGVIAAARVDEARAELRQAQSEAGEATRMLAASGASDNGVVTLRAPIAGRVSKVAVQTGGPVDGLTAPFVIDATYAYQLDLQLPERLAGTVKPGMAVSLPGNVTGTVLSVAPALDPVTRSVPAKARIGAAPGLIAGKSVLVALHADAQTAVVSVPSAAIVRIGDKDVVFVSTGKRFAVREVTLGGSANGQTAILSGLKPGEVIAASSIPELKMLLGEGDE